MRLILDVYGISKFFLNQAHEICLGKSQEPAKNS